MADKQNKVSTTEEYAIYHDVSPNIVYISFGPIQPVLAYYFFWKRFRLACSFLYGVQKSLKVLLLRFFNCLVVIMIVLSFVFCVIQGEDDNHTFYLLACNTVISLFCGSVVNWWYRQGDLGPEKYWYLFLLGFVIIFQCVTTDMYVFHGPLPNDSTKVIPATRINFNHTTRFTPHTTRNATTKASYLYVTQNPLLPPLPES